MISTKSESKPMQPCTPSIEPAITVTVANARTQAPIEATVLVQDGSFQEVLALYGATASGQNIYAGAFERSGTYTVTVSQPGYQTTTIKGIHVSKDACHVLTRSLNIMLKP
jgi:hypothetical protein